MILIPGLVGNACVIMKTHLTYAQTQSCRTIIYRAFARIDGDPNGSMGAMTGYFANLLILWFSFYYSFDNTQVPTCLMCRQEE